jgi:hypothetical protein
MVAFVVLRNKAIKPLLVGAALGRAARSRCSRGRRPQLQQRKAVPSFPKAFGRAWLTDVRQPGGDRFLRLAGAPAAISVVLTHAILPRNEFVYLVHIWIMLTRVTLRVGVTL